MKNILQYTLLLTFFTACNSKTNTAPEPAAANSSIVLLTPNQLKNTTITTATIQKRSINTTLQVNGQIDVPPQNIVSVSMPLGGYLKSTKLLPGLHFGKGDVIAIMEDQQYVQLQQDYLITKTRLHAAEKEYQRQKDLNQSQASSDKIFQNAEADYKALRITLVSLAEKLKLIHINPRSLSEKNISKSVAIYAPINGFVSKVNVNIGKYVNPSDVLFELINPTDIHLNLKIYEKDITKLQIGQKITAFTNNDISKKYNCQIILISKDLSSDYSAQVHCHFDNYDANLLPGMYMNAVINIKNKNNFSLPEQAIVYFEGKNYAFICINKTTFKMIEVQTGNHENGFIEILNPTDNKNANFVTTGAYTLLMTLKNKPEE